MSWRLPGLDGMWRPLISGLICSVPWAMVVAADLPSGLTKGEFPPTFHVLDVTGRAKGQTLCYRCEYRSRPVVSIFAREWTDETAVLTARVERLLEQHADARMAGMFVLLTDDLERAETTLATAALKQKLMRLPLTAFDGRNGPESYKLNEQAAVTVTLWVDDAVRFSRGFPSGGLTKDAIQTVAEEAAKLLD